MCASAVRAEITDGRITQRLRQRAPPKPTGASLCGSSSYFAAAAAAATGRGLSWLPAFCARRSSANPLPRRPGCEASIAQPRKRGPSWRAARGVLAQLRPIAEPDMLRRNKQ